MDNSTQWSSLFREFVASPMDLHSENGMGGSSKHHEAGAQLPSPPQSNSSATDSPDEDAIVSISTTFFPSAQHDGFGPPNLVIRSDDSVFFYCHYELIQKASNNNFNSLLHGGPSVDLAKDSRMMTVPETASVINIVIHTIYNWSFSHYAPSFSDLVSAVSSLKTYGVDLQNHISQNSFLFNEIMGYAKENAIDIYILAASNQLDDLAVNISSYLLSYPLCDLTDEMVQEMGPIFLKRLFFLHFGRSEALKRLMITPPTLHSSLPGCDYEEQKKVTRAWALASAYIAWEAKPGLSTAMIDSALTPLSDQLACITCRKSLQERIHTLIVSWSEIKRTI